MMENGNEFNINIHDLFIIDLENRGELEINTHKLFIYLAQDYDRFKRDNLSL